MVLIAPVAVPDDGLIYSSSSVKLKIGEKIIDNGTLYITQSSLSWQPEHNVEGICISWKQISVHGISNSPSKCIYFMLDHKIQWRGVYEGSGLGVGVANGNGAAANANAVMDEPQNDGEVDEGNATDEEDGDDDVPEEEQMTECWLLPEDVNSVDTIFQAMTECQALHPDSADSISDESDFMDDDEDNNDDHDQRFGPNAGNGGDDADAAQGGMRNLNLNDERFADAD